MPDRFQLVRRDAKSLQRCLVAFTVVAALYGTSYQQFRHFDVDDPRGASDSQSYILLSYGDHDVPSQHSYRIIVPWLAGAVRGGLQHFIHDKNELDKLSFYTVNFAFMASTAYILFFILRLLGFEILYCLMGVMIFSSSRTTILTAGTPLADSAYFFAVTVVTYLTLKPSPRGLALANPFLVLTKETIIPILFLPFLVRECRRLYLFLSLAASLIWFFWVRSRLALLRPPSINPDDTVVNVIIGRILVVGEHIVHIFSLEGMHDVQQGFSFFLVFAVLGYFVNRRSRKYSIPPFFFALLLVAAAYALLNGNFGRMLFTAFMVVIPYALIFMEHVVALSSPRSKQQMV